MVIILYISEFIVRSLTETLHEYMYKLVSIFKSLFMVS